MGSKRIQRGQGDDLAGLNVMHRNQIREQNKAAPAKSAVREFDSPQPDARVSGDYVNAKDADAAGFKVYREAIGGRAKGAGKRVTS